MNAGAAPTGTTATTPVATRQHPASLPRLPRPRPRLLWLELRRNPDLWIVVLFGAVAGWITHLMAFADPVVYWTDASLAVLKASFVLGPVAAAMAARAAARDRWSNLEEVVATTARPEAARHLTSWAAVALAVVVAHLLIATYVLVRAAAQVVWDGPYYATMLAGPAAVVAASAFGYAIGAAWTSQVAPAAVTIGAFLLLLRGANREESGWSAFLSPLHQPDASPWTGISPDLGPWPALFWLALAGVFIGTLALRRSHPVSPALLGLSALLAVACAAAVAARVPEDALVGPALASTPGMEDPNAPAAGTYDLVCDDGPIPVCVHPAHAPFLDTASGQINRALAPLVDLPGADTLPTRVDLLPRSDPAPPAGVVSRSFSDGPASFALWSTVLDTAGIAVGAPPLSVTVAGTTNPAQPVIRAHLLQQTGVSVTCTDDRLEAHGRNWGSSGFGGAVSCDALARFAALAPAEQRAWLAANLPALRAAQLTLEDLP